MEDIKILIQFLIRKKDFHLGRAVVQTLKDVCVCVFPQLFESKLGSELALLTVASGVTQSRMSQT